MRLIDADALLERERATGFAVGSRGCGKSLLTICRNYLHIHVANAPTIDAVPVVRCKDCVYYEEAKVNELGFIICRASGMEITENDFCSYGERRSDA